MKTWSMPKPPEPDVEKLIDNTGRVFRRMSPAGDYWVSEEPGPGRGTYAWADLLFQRDHLVEAT